MNRRAAFRYLTIVLFALSVWTAYANVVSDDSEVRAKAREAVGQVAGCGDVCQLEGLRGDRGMLSETIEYDVRGRGHFVVVCRRAFVAFGEHTCVVKDAPPPAPR